LQQKFGLSRLNSKFLKAQLDFWSDVQKLPKNLFLAFLATFGLSRLNPDFQNLVLAGTGVRNLSKTLHLDSFGLAQHKKMETKGFWEKFRMCACFAGKWPRTRQPPLGVGLARKRQHPSARMELWCLPIYIYTYIHI